MIAIYKTITIKQCPLCKKENVKREVLKQFVNETKYCSYKCQKKMNQEKHKEKYNKRRCAKRKAIKNGTILKRPMTLQELYLQW